MWGVGGRDTEVFVLSLSPPPNSSSFSFESTFGSSRREKPANEAIRSFSVMFWMSSSTHQADFATEKKPQLTGAGLNFSHFLRSLEVTREVFLGVSLPEWLLARGEGRRRLTSGKHTRINSSIKEIWVVKGGGRGGGNVSLPSYQISEAVVSRLNPSSMFAVANSAENSNIINYKRSTTVSNYFFVHS